MLIYYLISVAVFLIFYNAAKTKRKRFQNLPKDPTGLPIIGNILQLGLKPHLKLSKWAKEFGPIYTIDILGTPAIIINDLKTMRDLFGNANATGKFTLPTLDIAHRADYGVLNTEGSVWMEQHKFFMKVLREFGFHGGNQLYPFILKECNYVCDWIDEELKVNNSCSCSINLHKTLLYSITNLIWNAVTGEEHTFHENKMVTLIDKLLKGFNEASVLTFMPWLRFIVPGISGWNNLIKTSNEFQEHVHKCFEVRKTARILNKNDSTGKVVDAYLEHVESCQDVNSTFYGENGMKHAYFAVINLLLAASETTSSAMNWLIYYLLAYPDVQRKLQAEVDAVVKAEGSSFVGVDKTRLPYLEAVILEVLRISNLVPLGVMHKLLDDVTYDEYTLPKGTYLIANLYHAHMDTNIWKDPKTFRPERFLEGTEAERKKLKDCLVAFQEGRRKCPGELAAKDMILLYSFKLVERYSFHKEENRSVNEYLESVSGFLLLPPELGVVVKRRYK